MGRLSRCRAFILSSDNYNINDWVLKETLLGRILNSACAAWRTGESAQTLSQFLISSAREKKIGPCYTALSESLIIIFVRAALFTSTSVSSDCKLYSPRQQILAVPSVLLLMGPGNLFFFYPPPFARLLSPSLGCDATRCSLGLFLSSLTQTR